MRIQIELESLDELAEFIAIIRGEHAVDPAAMRAVTADLAQSTTDIDDAVKAADANNKTGD